MKKLEAPEVADLLLWRSVGAPRWRAATRTMTIYHTEVPARLRGRGHGARLVMGALSQARSKGYKIVPSCWFVGEVMSASSKYDDLWADRSSK